MGATTGKDSDRAADNSAWRMARTGLCATAVCMAARVLWLAVSTGPEADSAVREALSPPVASAEMEPNAGDEKRLTPTEAAALAAVCPVGMEALPEHLRPAEPEADRSAARARITGIRIASLSGGFEALRGALGPAEAAGGAGEWLVPPERWFAPEDRRPTEPSDSGAAPSPRMALELSKKPLDRVLESAAPVDAAIEELADPMIEPEGLASPALVADDVTPWPEDPAASLESAPESIPAPPAVLPPPPPPATPRPEASLRRVAPNQAAPPRPLTSTPPANPHAGGAGAAAAARAAAGGKSGDESHAELFAKNCYPSALDCAECHKAIYDEWSVSGHAYAFVSPMFHVFEQKLTDLSQGTVGHFCQRCHGPVATAMGYDRSTPIGEMPTVAREGVTCIACHRVNQRFAKSNGERRIVPGDVYQPVYGGFGGDGVAAVIAERDKYKVKTSDAEKGPGQPIHREGRFFDQLTRAEACTSCHQVAVHPGIKLEVVWEQYRQSPACKKGVTCQECHMGRVPGVAAGYDTGPVAEVAGKKIDENRKRSSHIFYGPGYSLAHPGIFPQHKKAQRWKVDEWVEFDWRAGWGTDDFEDAVADAEDRGEDTDAWFPQVWRDVDDRYDAREIIDDNLDRLKVKRRFREVVMENGSKVDGPFFRQPPGVGRDLKFEYVVANTNEGHNLPTASLGAQPQLWANVVLIDPDGRRIWETGYTDSNGDLCDIHSEDVRHGRAPFDWQLFNLQTMFLYTGVTGTDREFTLPVNVSFDQVPHLRPGTTAYTVANHPPFIRMESRSIAPLGKKRVKYRVPAELMCKPGRYRLSFRMRSRVEPPYFMRFCNATTEMQRAMIEGTLDIHPQSVEFEVR